MQGAFNVDWDSVLDDPGLDEETSRLYQRGAESAGRPVVAARLEAEPEIEAENESEIEAESETEVGGLRAGMRMPRGRGRVHIPGHGRGRGRGAPLVPAVPARPVPARPGAPVPAVPAVPARPVPARPGAPVPARPAVPVQAAAPVPQPAEQHFRVDNYLFFVMDGSFGVRPGRAGHYIRPYIINRNHEAVPFPPPPGYDHNNPPPPRVGRPRGSPPIIPNQLYCHEGRDYLLCADPGDEPAFYEIGRETLKPVLELGEERDLEFARKMQA